MLLALQLLNLLEDAGASDTVPDAFAGETKTGQALGATIVFTTFVPVGYDTATTIEIAGDASSEYSINAGAYTAAPGTLNPGESVTVRHTASGTNDTAIISTLTIGGVNGIFTSVTLGAAGQGSLIAFRRRGRR